MEEENVLDIIKNSTKNYIDKNIKIKTVVKYFLDEYTGTYENYDDAFNEVYADKIYDYVDKLLGRKEIDDFDTEWFGKEGFYGFDNGYGYLVLTESQTSKFFQIIEDVKNLDESILRKLNYIRMCVGTLENEPDTFIRVGQPFFIGHQSELVKICIN